MLELEFECRQSEFLRTAPSSLPLPRRLDLYILSGVPPLTPADPSEGDRKGGCWHSHLSSDSGLQGPALPCPTHPPRGLGRVRVRRPVRLRIDPPKTLEHGPSPLGDIPHRGDIYPSVRLREAERCQSHHTPSHTDPSPAWALQALLCSPQSHKCRHVPKSPCSPPLPTSSLQNQSN